MADDPSQLAADMEAMAPYWDKVSAILDGVDAMRMAGRTYLPQFDAEANADYKVRLNSTRMANIFTDVAETLAQKPFARPVALAEDAPEEMATFQHDVDGAGNHLHVFAGEVMFAGIASAIDWIWVDYTAGIPDGATRAEEARLGARPIWHRIPASDMIAAYSDIIEGTEQFTHIRFREDGIERDGFKEEAVERVRVVERERTGGEDEALTYGPPVSTLWTKTGAGWRPSEPRTLRISRIPLVPFITGRRRGRSWAFRPPLASAADLQIEQYVLDSAIKYASTLTCHPVLTANGVEPYLDENGEPQKISFGPGAVLYAPPAPDGGAPGSWDFLEVSASSLQFQQAKLDKIEDNIRELGRQPLTADSGNMTTIQSGMVAEKGYSAVQAWALNLADALERALDITGEWMGLDRAWEPKVNVHKGFEVIGAGGDDFAHVLAMAESEDISREALLHEAKRRNLLDPDYDGDVDLLQIAREGREREDDEGDDLALVMGGQRTRPPGLEPDGSAS